MGCGAVALGLQSPQHTGLDVAVEGRQCRRCTVGIRTIEDRDECLQRLVATDAAGSLDGGLGQLVVGGGDGCNHLLHGLRCAVVGIAQPAEDVGLGIGFQFRIDLQHLRIEARQFQFIGQRQGIGADVAVGVLQGLQQQGGLFGGRCRLHLAAQGSNAGRLVVQGLYAAVGLALSEGRQGSKGVLLQVTVREQRLQEGHLGRCGYLAQLLHVEGSPGIGLGRGDTLLQSFTNGGAQGLAPLSTHVVRQSVYGVLERGALTLLAVVEVLHQHAYALRAGTGNFAHHLLQGVEILRRQLGQSVGHDGGGHAVAPVLGKGFAN